MAFRASSRGKDTKKDREISLARQKEIGKKMRRKPKSATEENPGLKALRRQPTQINPKTGHFVNPDTGKDIDPALFTGKLAGTEEFLEKAVGPHIASALPGGKPRDLKSWWTPVEALGILPVGKVIKGGELISRAATGGAKAAAKGENVAQAAKTAAKTKPKPAERIFTNTEGVTATIPAATSLTGRALEKAIDKVTPQGITDWRVASEAARTERNLAPLARTPEPRREYASHLGRDPGPDPRRAGYPDLVDEVFEPSHAKKVKAVLGKIARHPVETIVNDTSRLVFLYLNPKYWAAQVGSGVGLSVIQQGVFAGKNLPQAAVLSYRIGDRAKVIDKLMGTTGTGSLVPESKGLLGIGKATKSPISEKAGNIVSRVVDVPPRRGSWIHEAARQGYGDEAKLSKLIDDAIAGDKKALHDVDMITRRAKDALIDFDRLPRVIQERLGRIMWFLPWTAGATRYTIRFPFEHPAQSIVAGAAGYEYFEHLEPGQKFTQIVNIAGHPVDLSGIFPFETAVQLPVNIYQGAVEGDWEGIAGGTTPAFETVGKTLFGDSYGEGDNLLDVGKNLLTDAPQLGVYENITDPPTPEEAAEKLSPRGPKEEILRQASGGIWTTYNPEVGQQYEDEATLSAVNLERKDIAKVGVQLERATDAGVAGDLMPQYEAARLYQVRVDAAMRQLTEEADMESSDTKATRRKEGPTIRQRAAVEYQTLLAMDPEAIGLEPLFLDGKPSPNDTAEDRRIKRKINEILRKNIAAMANYVDSKGAGIESRVDRYLDDYDAYLESQAVG